MKQFALTMLAICLATGIMAKNNIDRKEVVMRHNPHITNIDPLSSLTVGNGSFAFTVDVTGL